MGPLHTAPDCEQCPWWDLHGPGSHLTLALALALTLALALALTLGGIFVGQVVKFAGGVRKGFAVIAALIITALLQRAIYGTPLTLQLYIALPCVILANVMYARNPYVAPTKVP